TRWGTLCHLPDSFLAYRDTVAGGDVAPMSTLKLDIELPALGTRDSWDEVASLVHSDDSAEGGDHFVVETDESRHSVIRFGNGRNGMELPDGAIVHATCQVGEPRDGNVGADTIVSFDASTANVDPAAPALVLRACWNPF